MSREQWAHGFYTGSHASKKNKSRSFVTTHVNGVLSRTGIVIEERDDHTITIEWIDYISMEFFASNGYYPDTSSIIPENVEDCIVADLEMPVFHATWAAVIGEFCRFVKESYQIEQQPQTTTRTAIADEVRA